MAQKDQGLIFKRAPYVDIVVGPGQLHQVPALIREVAARTRPADGSQPRPHGRHRDEIERSHESFDPLRDPAMRPTPYQAYRADHDRLRQILHLLHRAQRPRPRAKPPARRDPRRSQATGRRRLPRNHARSAKPSTATSTAKATAPGGSAICSSALHEIDGIARIKFVTNYPKDMTDDLLAAVRDLPKCSKYLHVPVQSGSNAVLKRMKRGYTVEEYREMLARTYEWIPGVAVTSDFIVGFCGETEDDFQQTVELVRESRFKNSFIFKYSERPGTKGADLYADDVPEDVKRRRNNELLAAAKRDLRGGQSRLPRPRGRRCSSKAQAKQPKSTAPRRRNSDRLQLTGRTHCDRIVVFEGNRRQIGQFLPIVIYDANAHTLFGEIVTAARRSRGLRPVAAARRWQRPKRVNGIRRESCYNGVSIGRRSPRNNPTLGRPRGRFHRHVP